MVSPPEWRRAAVFTAVFLAVLTLPFLVAAHRTPAGHVFSGLLLNPIDGNTYLAKMQAGARGDWLFRLPYTADPGPGILVYTYYLFLGHVAAWLSLPVLAVYHAARVLGGAGLAFTAYAFVARIFDSPRERLTAWLFTLFGAGLGWVAVLFGGLTADFWVAEAFPFLSTYTNPHFPLALAAMLWIYLTVALDPTGIASPTRTRTRPASWTRAASVALATLALALTQPLALLTVGLVLAGWSLLGILRRETERLWPVLVFGLVAVPWLAYTYWATHALPVMAEWTAQNVNLSPPVWDYLLAFGPAVVLLIPGLRAALIRNAPADRLLILWLALNAAALYLPVPFQRRLTMGIFFPLAALGAMGLRALVNPDSRRWWTASLLLISIAFPTNAMVMLAGIGATPESAPAMFLTRGEAAAMDWLRTNVPPRSLVLAGPETGLFIPARSGNRVVYGHPYETVHAETRRTEVERFFSGEIPQPEAEDYLSENGVDFVFVGPRELRLGTLLPVEGPQAVYARDGVAIYAVLP